MPAQASLIDGPDILCDTLAGDVDWPAQTLRGAMYGMFVIAFS